MVELSTGTTLLVTVVFAGVAVAVVFGNVVDLVDGAVVCVNDATVCTANGRDDEDDDDKEDDIVV